MKSWLRLLLAVLILGYFIVPQFSYKMGILRPTPRSCCKDYINLYIKVCNSHILIGEKHIYIPDCLKSSHSGRNRGVGRGTDPTRLKSCKYLNGTWTCNTMAHYTSLPFFVCNVSTVQSLVGKKEAIEEDLA